MGRIFEVPLFVRLLQEQQTIKIKKIDLKKTFLFMAQK